MEPHPQVLSDVEEKLNEYFKLKLKYEEYLNKIKKKISNNSTLSKREKRIEYLKIKPKCINCGKPGGTIFKNIYFQDTDKEEAHRQYSAKCGVLANPCALNIIIKVGNIEMLPDLLNIMQDEIQNTKNEIIEYKNKLLFGYLKTEDVLDKFDELKETISNYTSLYESYLEHYNKVVDNDETKRIINKHITETYILIEQIKECIIKMNETNNNKFAKDAVEIYIQQLEPTLKQIQKLKFVENVVWYDDDFKTYHLIQKKYNIDTLSYNSFNNIVSAYDVGLVIEPNVVNEDTHNVNLEIKKPEGIVPTQTVRTNISPEDILPEKPSYVENTVTWKNPAYIKIWERLPDKFKNLLLTDHDWLEDFMYNCVKNRANSKPCEFSAPNNLKMPPVKLANGSQDFGVKIYNELYEKLPESTKQMYLTLYNEKDGVKNYDMLINAMNNLVKKEVGYERGYF